MGQFSLFIAFYFSTCCLFHGGAEVIPTLQELELSLQLTSFRKFDIDFINVYYLSKYNKWVTENIFNIAYSLKLKTKPLPDIGGTNHCDIAQSVISRLQAICT